jgi:UDP-N-acetylglucosamine acyltransferase
MVAGVARVVQDVPPFALTDSDGRVAGLNRIGLRRAGFSREEIEAVREAYRHLYAPGARIAEAALHIAALADFPACARLAAFLSVGTRRGVVGRSRTAARRADTSDHSDT